MGREIIVVTAAYGHQQVAALGGQRALLPVIAAAGADGVEIRRELCDQAELDRLADLGQAISDQGLSACYSAPDTLFTEQGVLNPHLPARLQEAVRLNARWLKVSLGAMPEHPDVNTLKDWLQSAAMALVLENDQTDNGKLAPMARFQGLCREQSLPVTLTFDMGNWLWVGDSPERAAATLGPSVGYIHVKAAVRQGDHYGAVPPDTTGDNRWFELLKQLPSEAPRGIEFPLQGADLTAVTAHYVQLLREE